MNPEWARWIKASVAKHFHDILSVNYYVHHEGTIPDYDNQQDHVQFRMVGPDILKINPGRWRVDVAVNILCVSIMNETTAYRLDKTIGRVQAAFTPEIHLYKLGAEVTDDGSFLDCLFLRQDDSSQRIRTQQMGKIETDISMVQATVEGHFRTELRS